MARKGVSYVTAAQLVSMARDPRVSIVDVRDEEQICDAHITGWHHYASDGFVDQLSEIAEATRAKEILVFHCALSQAGEASDNTNSCKFEGSGEKAHGEGD